MRDKTVATLREVGIIPIIRAASADVAVAVVEAILRAGISVAEITMTVPNALDAMATVAKRFAGKVLLGAGTVTDAETARRAVDAGALFVVTPCLVPEVIEAAHRADVAVLPGALTPGEIFEAFRLGGDLIKIFPIQSLGGAAYLRALRGPFPHIPLVPTGGVTLDNIDEMFQARADGGGRRKPNDPEGGAGPARLCRNQLAGPAVSLRGEGGARAKNCVTFCLP
jgi:2-dehydro-3-deoxyphosphogluconate aldolase/(4S)-4-hydroxy-2-oxoglutarate aldolase